MTTIRHAECWIPCILLYVLSVHACTTCARRMMSTKQDIAIMTNYLAKSLLATLPAGRLFLGEHITIAWHVHNNQLTSQCSQAVRTLPWSLAVRTLPWSLAVRTLRWSLAVRTLPWLMEVNPFPISQPALLNRWPDTPFS